MTSFNLTSKKKICVDISNIIPGKGGSGGGIATYAYNLIKELDQINHINNNEFDIYCIKDPRYKNICNYKSIKIITTKTKSKNVLYRMYWLHICLPIFCLRNKIHLLHRLTPELPLIKVCKYVCTLHDLMFDFYLSHKKIKKFLKKTDFIKLHYFRLVTKYSISISDSIIVPSYFIKRELITNYKIKEEKIWVTHEATEIRKDIKNQKEPVNSEKLHLGVIAGFYPHKGHLRILKLAYKFVQSGFIDFKISFRGNSLFPNYKKEIVALKEKLGLNEHVFFIPYDSKAKLEDIYSEFNLIILLSEYEGFGLPVLEAQSYNLPVFCSDIPVFREILSNSGYYISDNLTASSIANIIADLNDQNLLNSLKVLGMSNLNKYSWEKMSAETIHLYKKILVLSSK